MHPTIRRELISERVADLHRQAQHAQAARAIRQARRARPPRPHHPITAPARRLAAMRLRTLFS